MCANAIGINNISNNRRALASYQIAIAWIENESKASYTWFLQTLCNKIYDIYGCLPNVFISNRDQALKNAFSKVFSESDKMLYVWHFLEQNLKVNYHKLFKDDNDYREFKKEGISITGQSELSHSAFKRAIEMASDLKSVFYQIDQALNLKHLKSTEHTGSNKVVVNLFIITILGLVSLSEICQCGQLTKLNKHYKNIKKQLSIRMLKLMAT
ncbi:29372_t:CDS:2 [Gigaspora margarita]|uniref:29372_t:CDS:1 n=1 Tax=Gigaspora margarita TaxID=4874 RepID=A0ABN7V871_GIGMA|nr:29372_t:CDS:2 [Gigaspora margarita]